MLVLDVIRYLGSRANKRSAYLSTFNSMASHHGQRMNEPRVSIIVPTRDRVELLKSCIESIRIKTTYKNYEVIVVDNGSTLEATRKYLGDLALTGIRILNFPGEFNYSKICNFASAYSESEFLCFLNNDTEVIEPNWLGYLMDHAVQPLTGAVGSKLVFPDGLIQHLGVALGYRGVAGHPFSGSKIGKDLERTLSTSCFEVSAVTFACVVISKSLYETAKGLDENFKVGLNDVDFCIRVTSLNKANQVCGMSSLVHHESATRKRSQKHKRFFRGSYEVLRFLRKFKEFYFSDRFFTLK